ncbi:sigma-70 family RNA polymerase sigma factor [Bengtsoniella intestinalis]|uniref:RNA polymerase sigma factor n=1 Tax=Bengtsoniella intestinalis TaxID=3073143 RepID=UPI00391EFE9F
MILYIIATIENDDDRMFMEQLYLGYRRLLYQEIFKIVQNEWETEDILQSVILKLIEKIPLLKTMAEAHLINYCVIAGRNTAFNHLRDKKIELPLTEEWYHEEANTQTSPVELYLLKKEEFIYFQNTWEVLDVQTRYLLESRFFLKKSYKEIAENLDMNEAAIRMAVTRAKRKVNRAILSTMGDR